MNWFEKRGEAKDCDMSLTSDIIGDTIHCLCSVATYIILSSCSI